MRWKLDQTNVFADGSDVVYEVPYWTMRSIIFKTLYKLNLILLNKNYLLPTLTPAPFFFGSFFFFNENKDDEKNERQQKKKLNSNVQKEKVQNIDRNWYMDSSTKARSYKTNKKKKDVHIHIQVVIHIRRKQWSKHENYHIQR